ncbi:hypothetical protein GCM10010530_39980 [Kribbella aluminosa]
MWKTRGLDCDKPFSLGGPRLRPISIGEEVARWAGVGHILCDVESDVFRFPTRSRQWCGSWPQ